MKRLAIVGKNKENVAALKHHLLLHGFVYDAKKPEFVVSLGGDGTYLYAERQYPSVPKLLVRDSSICNKCGEDVLDRIISKLKNSQYTIKECIKLDAFVNGKHALSCANDFILRNKRLTQAIRFSLAVDQRQIDDEMIGDGLVIATPYGSTAYYYSITKQHFKYGIGIAFNNLTRRMMSLVVGEDAAITIRMIREDAELAADNDKRVVAVREGDIIRVQRKKETARIIILHRSLLEWFATLRILGRRRSV